MSDWIGLFGNYETVGKKLKPHKTIDLDRSYAETDKLYSQRAVIQFNSTFVELIDRWNYWRGFITFFSFISLILMSFAFVYMVYSFDFGNDYYTPSIWEILFSGLVTIGLFLTAYGSWHFFNRECFRYTHYPIRFNRKLRKVYVIQPNKKLLVANWDDFNIGLQKGSPKLWDIRFSLLDEQEKVTDTFALPFTDFSEYDNALLGHWEFIRSYMEDDTPEKAFDALKQVFPIHNRKETIKESIERVMINNTSAYEQPIERLTRLAFWGTFPFVLIEIIGRIISIKTSKIPRFPDWVEHECFIDAEDPYNFEKYPKPKPPSEPIAPLEYVIYAVLLVISIILFLGFIDLLSMAKGENSGLLKALFFWW